MKAKKIIAIVMLVGCAAGAATAGYMLGNHIAEKNYIKQVEQEKDDYTSSLGLKMLSTIENDDGSVSKIISYSVEPANAIVKSINVTASFIDDSDCSDFIEVIKDEDSMTIEIKCKKNFDKQIKVDVVSTANENAKATLTIDYEKKLQDVVLNIGTEEWSKDAFYQNLSTFVNEGEIGLVPSYSLYTIDKVFVPSTKDFNFVNVGTSNEQAIEDIIRDDIDTFRSSGALDAMFTSINDTLNNKQSLPTLAELNEAMNEYYADSAALLTGLVEQASPFMLSGSYVVSVDEKEFNMTIDEIVIDFGSYASELAESNLIPNELKVEESAVVF